MSDSVRPHRWKPTRLPRPWDSPGKNTGVGCHFLLQCMKVKTESELAQLCRTLSDPMDCSLPGSSIHGIFQAKQCCDDHWGTCISFNYGFISVSLLLSHTQGYCYHLSKFHIYVLVYCIGVFLSGLLHSV